MGDSCENSASSPVPAAACSAPCCSDGNPCSSSSVTPTVSGSLPQGFPAFRSMMTLPTSTPNPELPTSSPPAFPVSRSHRPGSGSEPPTSVTDGHTPFAYYEKAEHHFSSARMCLDFSAQATSEPYSETWPKQGSMRSGACWEQTTSVPHIDASGCGYWPTATAQVRECNEEQWAQRRVDQGGTLRSTYLQDAVKYQVEARGHSTPQTWPTPAAVEPQWSREAPDRCVDKDGNPPAHHQERWYHPETHQIVQRSLANVVTWATPCRRDTMTHADLSGLEENAHLSRQAIKRLGETSGSLNPTWVGPLMGWPMNWEDSETPHGRELLRWLVSFRLSHMLYLTHGETNHRTAEEMRAMRSPDDSSPDAEWASGGHGDLPQEEVLFSLLCELKTALDEEADLSLACEEVDRDGMRSLRERDESSGTPHRWGPVPQPAGEHPDLVHHLSPLSPRYGAEAWKDGSWEAGIPRVATGVAHRVDRLRALGNGQVPQTMAAAWTVLARRAGL